MTFIQKTLLVLSLILTMAPAAAAPSPALASAVTPPTISFVDAAIVSGKLTVTWTAPQNADDVSFYRVYFSHESIVGNDGNYDDFERTNGPETTYSFTKLPLPSPKIFVAVLAVNAAGQESEGFETEASIEPSSSLNSSAAPETPATSTALPMSLISVSAVSQTGILLTFTKTLATATPLSTEEFFVTDLSGAILEIRSIAVSGPTVLLSTAPQEPDKEYLFGSLQPIPAADGTNLPTSNAQGHFRGFGNQSATPEPASVPYVRNPMLGQVTGGLPVLPVEEKSADIAKPTKKKDLPDSGVGLLGMTTLAGLLAGRQMLKRKEREILIG